MSSQTLLRTVLAPWLSQCNVGASLADQPLPRFAAARMTLVSLLLLAPLAFGAVEPWAQAALLVLSVVVLVCWAVDCFRDRQIVVAWTPLYIPALLLLFLAACQLIAKSSLDGIATRDSIVSGCGYLILFATAATVFTAATPAQWTHCAKVVTIYTLLLSLFAIVQSLSDPGKIYWAVTPRWGGYVFGPYVNHNHYAGLMEMLTAFTAAFWVSRQWHDVGSWLAGGATATGVTSVVLSGSRAGVACVLLEMVLLLAVAVIAQRRQYRPKAAVIGFWVALLSALLLAAWITPPETITRLASAVHSQNASFADRMVMARDALRIFHAYPLTGVGLGSFETAYPAFQTLATDFWIDHAHNDYAELLAETGIGGGILMAVAVAMFLDVCEKRFREPLALTSNAVVWLRLGATIGCLGLMVHSIFDFNLHIPANAAWFVFLTALACAAPEFPEGAEMIGSHPSSAEVN
jgi:O-antigen ligase